VNRGRDALVHCSWIALGTNRHSGLRPRALPERHFNLRIILAKSTVSDVVEDSYDLPRNYVAGLGGSGNQLIDFNNLGERIAPGK